MAPETLLEEVRRSLRSILESGSGDPQGQPTVALSFGRTLWGRLAPTVAPEDWSGCVEIGAGGAFVLTQRWVHDLAAFAELDVEEQGRVTGRTKVENFELEGDEMPATSHVSRTDVKVDGVALKMWRRNTHFGAAGDGLSDRLIEFSRAVSGSYRFAPGASDLARALG